MIMDIDWLQCLGAVFGAIGAFLVASQTKKTRRRAFECFALSNIFIIFWAIHHEAWWIVGMQYFFIFTSARGMWANRSEP